MVDTFIREIPANKLTDKMVEDFEARGLKLKWKDETVEVWAINTEEKKP